MATAGGCTYAWGKILPQSHTPVTLLENAIRYLKMGLPVFPVGWDKNHKKRKTPLVPWRGYATALPSEDDIRHWWTRWPDAGIGLAVGKLTGFLVIDAEHDADMSLFRLLDIETPRVRTGGGGWHFYFKNETTGNSVGKIAPRYDVKTEGGYVLLPPSPHDSGGTYAWDIPIGTVTPASLPETIRAKIIGTHESKIPEILSRNTPQGSRNNTATSIAGMLLGEHRMDRWESVVWPLLQAWNTTHATPPLGNDELKTVYESIAKTEKTRRAREGVIEGNTPMITEGTYAPMIVEDRDTVVVQIPVEDGLVFLRFSDVEFMKNHTIDAVLSVELITAGGTPRAFEGRINVLSLSAREGFARALTKTFGRNVAWDLILSQAASALKKHIEHKDTSCWFEDAPKEAVGYLLEPFIVLGAPNLFFGRGGSGKTFITLRIAYALATGTPFLGMTPAARVRTLFVDYESTSGTLADRLELIRGAPNLADTPFDDGLRALRYYSPSGIPIADCLPALKRIIAKHDIGLIIVDSAALACGGEPEKAEIAIRYFNALASLKTTSLTIAHETKQENHAYAFGSVFWANSPRNIWNIACTQEQEDRVLHSGLHHRKANDDRRRASFGCRIFFGDGFVDMGYENPAMNFPKDASLVQRIRLALSDGPKDLAGIATVISDAKNASLKNALTKGSMRNLWGNVDGVWRLFSTTVSHQGGDSLDTESPGW
ncbi:MAG: bifunctional DNA primase/polymerase [Candidatus Eisenbacteria bacterium]|nr:bifunctional DNA primase/polymerase [Candidatus Eisenbacteria bacterium]